MTEQDDKPTLQLADAVDSQAPTEREPPSETGPITERAVIGHDVPDHISEDGGHNDLEPSRVRFILICLLFALFAAWLVVNNYNLLSQESSVGWEARWTHGRQVIIWVDETAVPELQLGDEVLSVNGLPVNISYEVRRLVREFRANESYSLQISRNGERLELNLTSQPLAFETILNSIYLGIVQPIAFFVTGLLLFLFKPHNKLTVLIAITFALTTGGVSPLHFTSYAEASFPVVLIWQIGYFLSLFNVPVLLHFLLLFPKPSPIVRRLPRITTWLYFPFLFYVLPSEIANQLSWNGLTAFDIVYDSTILFLGDYLYSPYLLAGLAVLVLNYRDSEEHEKRKMRVLMAGIPFAVAPVIVADFILPPVAWLLDFQLFRSSGWRDLAGNSLVVLAPPIFAYAVIRHRVIPISFIIRRWLQYIFAKNGLRLLVVLPVLGIIWNVAANPNRTLAELIFQNSLSFYMFIVLAVGFGLLLRFRLNEWIDRKFFREQYNQEKLLRGLIESVMDADSMAKLSRLVSGRIQTALHPSSLHFFYEDKRNSTFSLGYSTGGGSQELKLGADSPLLRFMQNINHAIDYPSPEADDLPPPEKAWLKRIEAGLLVPMHGTDEKLAGFFILGKKLSEIPYTSRDKELLDALADQIALAHENLSLKERVRSEQKIKAEVLSRFDGGSINLLKECPKCGKCFDFKAARCDADGSELTLTLPVERVIENRYRLERLIGKGGMGAVYEASDLRISRRVAVKILGGSMFGNTSALRRFQREARTAGRLQHPNIVTVFDYGVLSTEGAFLVMELIPGESLGAMLDRVQKLDLPTAKSWFEQILNGVEAAHSEEVIHRDLKPDNILVSESGTNSHRLLILDFGIAKVSEPENLLESSVTVPGTVLGTFGYMSPEQLRGEKADARSDLFSMAVIIYEALHGIKPYKAASYQEFLTVMSAPVTSDNGYSEFFKRGLAYEPENRFASAYEMKRSLRDL